MNIFDQYGIKEVADVTLYGITYDKYENEVYIPIMYFDTLKVSTVEQTTEQTSARGGLGNAEHVIWDFGKEINITLQDALYTPASQSMLWGGLYGLKPIKVKGVWVPAIYPEDEYGNIIYYKKKVQSDYPLPDGVDLSTSNKWIAFYCPCDYEEKYMTYEPIIKDEFTFSDKVLTRGNRQIQFNGNNVMIGDEVQNYSGSQNFGQAERAELLINNFENFVNTPFDINEEEDKYSVVPAAEDLSQKTIHSVLEYQWQNSMGQMITTTVNKKQAYADDIDFCIHSFEDNNNKRFLFGSYPNYVPYKHFYKTITKKLKGFDIKFINGTKIRVPAEKEYSFKIYLGTFIIIEDWNIDNTSEEPGLHLINSKIKDVSLLNSLRGKQAIRDFAIDVDKNILSYNRMKDPKYSNSNLTVYIDPNTLMPYEANIHEYTKQNGTVIQGNLKSFKQGEYYLQYSRIRDNINKAQQVEVRAQDYPGTFKLVGETYCRNRFGEDTHYQFEIPLCKLISNVSLNLAADGEPTTVDMSFKVLRQADGTMMKMTQYNLEEKCETSSVPATIPVIPKEKEDKNYTIKILSPTVEDIYCVDKDCRIKDYNTEHNTYLRLPTDANEGQSLLQEFQDGGAELFRINHKEILLVELYNNNNPIRCLTKQDNTNIELSIGSEI